MNKSFLMQSSLDLTSPQLRSKKWLPRIKKKFQVLTSSNAYACVKFNWNKRFEVSYKRSLARFQRNDDEVWKACVSSPVGDKKKGHRNKRKLVRVRMIASTPNRNWHITRPENAFFRVLSFDSRRRSRGSVFTRGLPNSAETNFCGYGTFFRGLKIISG